MLALHEAHGLLGVADRELDRQPQGVARARQAHVGRVERHDVLVRSVIDRWLGAAAEDGREEQPDDAALTTVAHSNSPDRCVSLPNGYRRRAVTQSPWLDRKRCTRTSPTSKPCASS